MRQEGDWIIAETGEDRLLFQVSYPEDQYAYPHEGLQWKHYDSWTDGAPYSGEADCGGVLVRRPIGICSAEVMLAVKTAGESMHFL